jgi:hypothetical protein
VHCGGGGVQLCVSAGFPAVVPQALVSEQERVCEPYVEHWLQEVHDQFGVQEAVSGAQVAYW